jgi:2-keto-4-pentenoate hydratase/2-oxohepta-3-ene-1,7-dioic acid hydratase in catechol pathway
MNSYKLLSYGLAPNVGRSGILIGDEVFDAARLTNNPAYASTLGILEDWDEASKHLETAITSPGKDAHLGRLASISLLAPILFPGTYFCAAANYRDHHEAMAKKFGHTAEPANPHEHGIKPFHFTKSGKQATVGPGEQIAMPHYCEKFDWELELAAVIGRACRRVASSDALDYVAGYCVGNDLSVRDGAYMKRANVRPDSPFNTDFIGIKGFDQSAVLGPWITPSDQVGDPANLAMKLWIDDELKQDSNSSQMIFSIPEQISYLSERITLLPGDVILTGTPAGTGAESGRFLQRGQTIRMWIENIGETSNRVF